MPGSSPLDVLPFWAVFIVMLVLILVAVDAGYRFGAYRRARVEDEREAPVGAMVGATLAHENSRARAWPLAIRSARSLGAQDPQGATAASSRRRCRHTRCC